MLQNRKFQHYTVYAKVGQLKVNNNQVMCHQSMKLSENHSDEKRSHSLTLKAKVKVIAKIKSQCPGEQKPCLPKYLSRGSLSNWCDADADANVDADADTSQTIC